jgi:hypothetical protein
MSFWLFVNSLWDLKWARKCWSAMGTSGNESAGPLRECVKVDDCCDLFSGGTLTLVKTIETTVKSVLPLNVCDLQW